MRSESKRLSVLVGIGQGCQKLVPLPFAPASAGAPLGHASFAIPMLITWQGWDVRERSIFLGGEGHGVCTSGPRPKFHFLTLPGHFPPRH